MRSLALALLCLVGCAGSSVLPPTDQCEFQPGDIVRVLETDEIGRVVAIHRWDSDWCLNDVLLGAWIVEDILPNRLRHVD
jgi:hypothetical protein